MITVQALGFELGKMLVSIAIGFVIGWIARGYKEKYQSAVDNEKVIALLIALAWVTSVGASILNPSYQTPLALHGLMGSVVGFYYKQKPKV